MDSIDIRCAHCASRMRLSGQLLGRIAGRTGRVSCKSCGAKIRLDATGPTLEVVSGAAALRDSSPEQLRTAAEKATSRSTPGSDSAPPSAELAFRGQAEPFNDLQPESDPVMTLIPLSAGHEPIAPSHSAPECEAVLPLSSSLPPPLPKRSRAAAVPAQLALAAEVEERGPQSDSLSPHSVSSDEQEDGLVPMGREFQSSPRATERERQLEELYAHVGRKSSKAPSHHASLPQPASTVSLRAPLPPSVAGADTRVASLPPAPPRPWELPLKPASAPPPSPFDARLGIAATAPMAGPISLAPDGTLVNLSDAPTAFDLASAVSKKPAPAGGRGWVSGVLAAAAGVVLTLGAVQLSQRGLPDLRVERWLRSSTSTQSAASLRSATTEKLGSLAAMQQLVVEPAPRAVELVLATTASPDSAAAANSVVSEPVPQVAARDAKRSPALPTKKDGSVAAPNEAVTPAATVSPELGASEPVAEEEEVEEAGPVLPPFSAAAASVSMKEATALAMGCRRPEDPSGTAQVVVTFAPSGRVTRATVSGPPYSGTPTGGCLASRFRSATVPPFSGEHVTVTKTVVLR